MAHELFGNRYFGRKAAWHKLGTVNKDGATPTEALAIADLDYLIDTYPLMIDVEGLHVPTGGVAIVREPVLGDNQYRVLGTANDRYTYLQNYEITEAFEPLADRWPLETIGALGEGETLFLTLDAGEEEIKGDPVHQYFLVADTRDGGTAMSIAFTPIRVVCQNTLIAGKEAAISSATLRHTSAIKDEVDWRVQLLGQMQEVQSNMMGAFEVMAETVLTDQQIDDVLTAAYPFPRKPKKVRMAEQMTGDQLARVGGLMKAVDRAERSWQTERDRAVERRGIAGELFRQFNDEQPDLARTAWAAYNAVVEFEDFREAQGAEDPDVSALFGNRARVKQRAYSAAFGLTVDRRTPQMAVVR